MFAHVHLLFPLCKLYLHFPAIFCTIFLHFCTFAEMMHLINQAAFSPNYPGSYASLLPLSPHIFPIFTRSVFLTLRSQNLCKLVLQFGYAIYLCIFHLHVQSHLLPLQHVATLCKLCLQHSAHSAIFLHTLQHFI